MALVCVDFAVALLVLCRLEREKAQAVYVARQDLEKKIDEAKRELEGVRFGRCCFSSTIIMMLCTCEREVCSKVWVHVVEERLRRLEWIN